MRMVFCFFFLVGAPYLTSAGVFLHVNSCDSSLPTQRWDFSKSQIVQRSSKLCVDIDKYATADRSPVWVYACHPQDHDPAHQNQVWAYNSSTQEITAIGTAKGMNLDVSDFGTQGPGSEVWLFHRTGAANQQWVYNQSTGQLKSMQNQYSGDLCLDTTSRPCDITPGKDQPWCDSSKPLEDRVDDLVSRIQASEIVGLFSNGDNGVPSLKIPKYQWWSEALHGVGYSPGVSFSDPTPYATSFPQVQTTSMSFNTTLFHALGTAISTEARAFNNVAHAGNTFWTPNINIFRDPRWGRGQETPGEDPVLNSHYAANFPKGMQEGEDPHHIKASSCLKHYSAYSLENWHGVDRHHFNAEVSQQDLADTYFPAFQSGVQDGNASGLMCSYNAVNGVPSCADKNLLQGQIRDTWRFNGYITSDCGAVADIYSNHKYTNETAQTCKDVLQAGMDSDCGGFLGKYLQAAIDSGVVTKTDYTTALKNLFRVRMRLGQFDPVSEQPYLKYGLEKINTPAHQALALEAARQGMTLLKNDDHALPLASSSSLKVAVVGPNADATLTLQGNYQGRAPFLVSVVDGVQKFTKADVLVAKGCALVACPSDANFSEAVDAAKKADVTILVMGLDQTQESEGHDRTEISFPGKQNELIEQVAAASNHVILVVMAGGMVDLSAAKSNKQVKAILWVGYPGQSGGTAIAQTLFGVNSPAGKLTQTIYPASYTQQCSMFDMNMRPNSTTGCPGRSHRFYTGPAVYKFGDGLSYSTWKYSVDVSVPDVASLMAASGTLSASHEFWSSTSPAAQTVVTASVTVTNTGNVTSDHVILLFSVPPVDASKDAPLRNLAAFQRVHAVKPGAKVTVHLPILAHAVSFAAPDGRTRIVPAGKWQLQLDNEEIPFEINYY